ncbi:hypothetical protein CMI42_05490 [Candidatus Pacearchaeota archaeon]|nr:hypothetical protein [Candidatus Pacearchaeota archaeon]
MHSKGYCAGCYQTIFQLDKIKAYNYRKWHNIEPETYKKITEKCIVCGYIDIVELHHLDGDKKNNSETNLVGLCPNDHKKIHRYEFREGIVNEINEALKSRGLPPFEAPKIFIQNNPRV